MDGTPTFKPISITLPKGTEIDTGVHEDSDPSVLIEPTKVVIIGERRNDAIPIKLIGEDGRPSEETFFWHQQERPSLRER